MIITTKEEFLRVPEVQELTKALRKLHDVTGFTSLKIDYCEDIKENFCCTGEIIKIKVTRDYFNMDIEIENNDISFKMNIDLPEDK